MFESAKKLYIIVAVVCFTVAFPLAGKSPLQWGMVGFRFVMSGVNGLVE